MTTPSALTEFRTGTYVEFIKFNIGQKLGAATGDILFFTDEELTVLSPGAAGEVLISAGPGMVPTYGPSPPGVIPDPLTLGRLNVNEIGGNSNPGLVIEFQNPPTLDFAAAGDNFIWGPNAGGAITTGTGLTAFGAGALTANTTGDDNTVLGSMSGTAIVGGSRNTIIGQGIAGAAALTDSVLVGDSTAAANTSVVIGSGASCTMINTVVVGQGSSSISAGDTVVGQGATSLVDDAVVLGRAATAGAGSTQSIVIGATASSTGANSLVLGHGASSAVANGVAIGENAMATTANGIQFGEATDSGTMATMRFRSQIVADESWIGGGITSVVIDNNGNLCRGSATSTISAMTTDATPTVMATYTVANNTVRRLQCSVVGHRTGGSAGSPNDTYSVQLDTLIKNDGGVITEHEVVAVQIKDQPSWVIEFNISGTDAQLRVTGAVNNDITWEATVMEFTL